jgi:hypothetical protein
MRIQPATPTAVRSPLTASHTLPPSKSFSEHVSSMRETSSARTVTAPAATTSTSSTSSVQSSLDQGEDQNMQYLQLQSQVNDQSETFTTLSNVMKTENDTIKNTASNMAM